MGETVRENKKIVPLQFPIPIEIDRGDGSKEIQQCASLTFNRLKTKHLKLLPASFWTTEGEISPVDMLPIIAAVAGISEAAADEIDLADLETVAEAIESFLPQSLKTGKT
uniref:Tail assembly chaperone n=1 Tax=viral metagenome TaxID=1070528 RepID=A0A6M3ITP5_9ZZZZ